MSRCKESCFLISLAKGAISSDKITESISDIRTLFTVMISFVLMSLIGTDLNSKSTCILIYNQDEY